ncbi:Asparagine--tRNA ligase [Gossypium arboreum]|uniref:Asparagine--tRNA ligase n=1 Tax=Gossypium arboreum TaxID=29729 RepID=A0A0B0NLY9_GOSAR|nr:Asparagine--tRNA ligase [Gossypium arboreum]
MDIALNFFYHHRGVAFYFHRPETHLLSEFDCLGAC